MLIVSFLLRVSGAWLGVLPVPSLGTELDNESLKIALGVCLGVPIVVKHNVFVVVKLMFLVLTVCLADVVEAVT